MKRKSESNLYRLLNIRPLSAKKKSLLLQIHMLYIIFSFLMKCLKPSTMKENILIHSNLLHLHIPIILPAILSKAKGVSDMLIFLDGVGALYNFLFSNEMLKTKYYEGKHFNLLQSSTLTYTNHITSHFIESQGSEWHVIFFGWGGGGWV